MEEFFPQGRMEPANFYKQKRELLSQLAAVECRAVDGVSAVSGDVYGLEW